MALIPFQNFAFTDPVAAQQAVQMGQILTLAQAEKDRNMANLAMEAQRQNTARQNAIRQEAITQAQMRQQMDEAERARKARAAEVEKRITGDKALVDAEIAGKERIAKLDLERTKGEKSNQSKYQSVAALIDSEDPPTDSEFESLVSGLDPDQILQLRTALEQNRRGLLALVDEAKRLADFWNPQFKGHWDPEKPEDRAAAQAKLKGLRERYAKDRRANDLLFSDPKTFELKPKYSGPRMDAPTVSSGGVTPIEELRSRLGSDNRLIGVRPIPSPGFVPQPTDFMVPLPEQPQQTPIVVPRMIPLGY